MKPFPPHIFACSDLLSWTAARISRGMTRLPASMQAEIMRYRRHEDRCRSLAGKLLLRYGLGCLGFSTDLSGWQHAGANGRPFLPQRPVFSISHTGPLAICGIADPLIGVDAESVGELPLNDFSRVFTREEIQAMNTAQAPQTLFFTLWTRKEAVLKAMGTGFFFPPDELNVLSSPVHIKGRSYYLHPLPTGAACVGHAALAGETGPVYRVVDGEALFEDRQG